MFCGNDEHRCIHEQLDRIEERVNQMSTSMTNLQAADDALKAEVVQVLADVATAIANANNGANPAIDQVAADVQAQIAALKAGDPIQPIQQPPTPAS